MKVYMSNYRNHWLSPYTILEKVLFWKNWDNIDYDEPWVVKWSDRLEPFCVGLRKALDFIFPRINYVKIDRYDTWSADITLAHIILPMLKQLKETKRGAPHVDDEDVPEELRSTNAEPKEHDWDTDSNWFKRWDWIMNEMIWSFEQTLDDNWDIKYHTGVSDYHSVPCEWDENGKPTLYSFEPGPNHTAVFDKEGYMMALKRIDNGLMLFGKYFRGLWD